MPNKILKTITPEGLRNRYVIALSIVALLIIGSQLVIQGALKRQKNDSHVVNIAGRQRMLSQKITKTALYLYNETDAEDIARLRAELAKSLSLWMSSQRGLMNGDPENGLPGENSEKATRLYQEIQRHHNQMVAAANQILRLTADSSYAPAALSASLRQIELHEQPFLEGMDDIVDRYDLEARRKVDRIRITEYALGILTLLTLTAEALLIFRPAGLSLRHTLEKLKSNERDIKKLFDVAPSGMFLVGAPDLNILRLSGTAVTLTGLPLKECIGRSLYEFIEPINVDLFSALSADGERTTTGGIDVTFSGVQGGTLNMIMSVSCINYRNEPAYLVGLADISERIRNEELLNRLATTDGMTGLLNRRTGLEILRKEVEQVKRDGELLTVAFIDLNELKAVNDGISHEEGDWMIIAFAEAIGTAIRASDSAIRYGGDEFLIVFSECSRDVALDVMLRMEMLAIEATKAEKKPYDVCFSYGLATCDPTAPLSAEELVNRADEAMYEMKRLSKGEKDDAVDLV